MLFVGISIVALAVVNWLLCVQNRDIERRVAELESRIAKINKANHKWP